MFEHIGQRIRKLRKSIGLTQQQLADRVRVHVSFLGHVERGNQNISVKTLKRI
ncbi:helix-turn-helix domain-containing protein [Paenibacillus sp. GYB004]|uniref:helix-turn-helix domain-containing protein n=1 Tax=Paenibacillus sp. GYB004 TaxID=2994393 RepID=UPI003FA70898